MLPWEASCFVTDETCIVLKLLLALMYMTIRFKISDFHRNGTTNCDLCRRTKFRTFDTAPLGTGNAKRDDFRLIKCGACRLQNFHPYLLFWEAAEIIKLRTIRHIRNSKNQVPELVQKTGNGAGLSQIMRLSPARRT